MDWPGEKLLVRLWKTADRGFGGLLAPWQIRRTGQAHIDVERQRRLVEAQTHLDVEDLLSGQKRLTADHTQLLESGTPEARLLPEAALAAAQRATVSDELRSQRNVAKALLVADAELRNDEQEPPEREVDEDWFFLWRKLAGGVSSENLQALWGRVLAGEVKSPGSFSLRTLDFLKNVSQEEALIIEKVAPFVCEDAIFYRARPTDLVEDEGVALGMLLSLVDLGLLNPLTNNIQKIYSSDAPSSSGFEKALLAYDRALIVKQEKHGASFRLKCTGVTRVGGEILRLGTFSPNEGYLRRVAELIKQQQFRVFLCRFAWATDDTITYSADVEL